MPDHDAPPPRFSFRPALRGAFRGLTRQDIARDLLAGCVVGVVAIPLALAFAIASGVKPEAGLATAVVAGFLISALGGSRVQIGGPTGAFVVIVYGVVQAHGIDGLAIATLMAGVLLIALGLLRVGRVIRFIPEPVVTGFTAGIGAIILIGQLKEVLGLSTLALPAEVPEKLAAIAGHLGETNPWAVGVAATTVGMIVLVRRFVPRVPGPVIALVTMTLVVAIAGLPVETIGDRFGELTPGLPLPSFPAISLARIRELVPSAIAIALLGAIESLLSAVVADAMLESRHDSDQELVAQGLANLASPLFGGIPATGAIARTATNVQNGGRTPLAGMTHAVVVLVAVTFLPAVLGRIPLAVLGGILVVVAWFMSDVPRLLEVRRMPRADALVLGTTFALTVLVDLVVAVEVGMVLAAFHFMLRMSEAGGVEILGQESDGLANGQQPIAEKDVPAGVLTYSVDGPFFFGAAERFQRTLSRMAEPPPVLILRMRHVPYVDATGLSTLGSIVHHFRERGTTVILSAVRPGPLAAMRRSGLVDEVGEDNVQPDVDAALTRAGEILLAQGTPAPTSP